MTASGSRASGALHDASSLDDEDVAATSSPPTPEGSARPHLRRRRAFRVLNRRASRPFRTPNRARLGSSSAPGPHSTNRQPPGGAVADATAVLEAAAQPKT